MIESDNTIIWLKFQGHTSEHFIHFYIFKFFVLVESKGAKFLQLKCYF